MKHCKSFSPQPIVYTLLAALSGLLFACASQTPKPPTAPLAPATRNAERLPETSGQWQPTALTSLPGWDAADLTGLRLPLLDNCAALLKKETLRVWQPFCAALQLSKDPRTAIQDHLQAYAQSDLQGKVQGLATAYYEPVFAASLRAGGAYQWPLYAMPSPAYAKLPRKELTPDRAAPHSELQGRELAWLADPIESYLVHVQGSTRLKLPDGQIIRLAYAGHNGQPFTSVANVLIQQGVFKASEASNERLRAWARKQSATHIQTVLNTNARFIYFKLDTTPPDQGPAGAMGVPLGLHSVAVDPAFTPLGSVLWLDTPAQAAPTLKLAQDTGSAIKGAARVDLYFGTGDAAGEAAGKIKHSARVWLLWPKRS